MWALIALAAVALTVELTVSHGLADMVLFAFAVLLLGASYVMRARIRRANVYDHKP
jgi:hypothetical protein